MSRQDQGAPPNGHTPGPWRRGADLVRVHTDWRDAEGSCAPENFHRNGYAKTIAAIGKEDGDWRPIGQQVADARLIAAAPELLEALRGCVRSLEWWQKNEPNSFGNTEKGRLEIALAAIAKATGAS